MVGILGLPEELLVDIVHFLDVRDIISLRKINKRLQDISTSLVVWRNAYKRCGLAFSITPDMSSASEIERALVSAVQLDCRLSKDRVMPLKTSFIPFSQWPINTTMVGKYVIFRRDDEDDFTCIDVTRPFSWSIQSPEPAGLRQMETIILGAREAVAHNQIGIVFAWTTKPRSFPWHFHPYPIWIFFQPLSDSGEPKEGFSVPMCDIPGPVARLRFSETKYIVGTVHHDVAVVDLTTSDRWDFNFTTEVYDFGLYGPFLFLAHFDCSITIIKLDASAGNGNMEHMRAAVNLDYKFHVHGHVGDFFPSTAAFCPTTGMPMVTVVLPHGFSFSQYILTPVITTTTHHEQKIAVQVDLFRDADECGPPSLFGADWSTRSRIVVIRLGHSRVLGFLVKHERWIVQSALLTEVRENGLVHKPLIIPEWSSQLSPDYWWDEVTGIVCLQQNDKTMMVIQL